VIRETMRTARKWRPCSSCGHGIDVGAVYREVVASPDHEGITGPHWWRLAECFACSDRYGHLPADREVRPAAPFGEGGATAAPPTPKGDVPCRPSS
jgi:hypothetical protein